MYGHPLTMVVETKTKRRDVRKENKMKKAIAILLVLLVAGVMFGGTFNSYNNDTESELILNTIVAGRTGVVISDTNLSGDTLGAKISSFLTLSEKGSVTFTEDFNSAELFIAYMTNLKNPAIVSVSASPLAADDVSTKIGYNVTIDSETPILVEKEGGPVTITFWDEGETAPANGGMRVESKTLNIAMLEADFLAATGGADLNYTTTWTVNLTQN